MGGVDGERFAGEVVEEGVVVYWSCYAGLGRHSVVDSVARARTLIRTHNGYAGMYVSGKTTRSARLVAASRMRPTVFCTVFSVFRKTGATLQAAEY